MTNFTFKISKKSDGPMNLVDNGVDNQERIANRGAFLSGLGLKNSFSVVPDLQHGSVIEVVEKSNWNNNKGATLPCDGLITTKKGLALTVGAGDCYPVFIYDMASEVICLLHCGWRGLAEQIVEKALVRMMKEFNCKRDNLHIQVGPGICMDCYEVGPEVFKAFGIYEGVGKDQFSLLGEIYGQLAYIPEQNKHFDISNHPCTFHNEKYFSARRDGKISSVLKTQLAVAIMT